MTAPHFPAPPQGPAAYSPFPDPPRGPGVQPPFPAPPVEGRGRRIGLGLGVGAGVAVLVCGGGLAAIIGVFVSSSGALQEQAHTAVSEYLDAVHDAHYDEAYGMLCQQAQDDESQDQFQQRVSAMSPISSYTLGDLNLVTLAVPVRATYESGQVAQLEAYLGQDTDTGALEVCELGE
jgi:trans-2-enoyl-CoA reductase